MKMAKLYYYTYTVCLIVVFCECCECRIERNMLEWAEGRGLWCLVYTGWRWRYFEATVFTLFWYSHSVLSKWPDWELDSKAIYHLHQRYSLNIKIKILLLLFTDYLGKLLFYSPHIVPCFPTGKNLYLQTVRVARTFS